MKPVLRSMLFALCATVAATLASAQRAPVILETVMQVAEAPSPKVTLPISVPGTLLMPACGDASCPPKSYPVTAKTQFFLRNTPISLDQLRKATLGKESLLAVGYLVRTGEVVSVRSIP